MKTVAHFQELKRIIDVSTSNTTSEKATSNGFIKSCWPRGRRIPC